MARFVTFKDAARRLSEAGRILHCCHAYADADSFGSAFAGMRAFGGDLALSQDPKQPAINMALAMDAVSQAMPNYDDYDLVVLYDTNCEALLPRPKPPREWALIDHHLDCSVLDQAMWVLHEPLDACCLVVDRLLAEADIPISPEVATAMIAGILGDTRRLRFAAPETIARTGELVNIAGVTIDQVLRSMTGPPTFEVLEEVITTFRSVEAWRQADLIVGLARPTSHQMAFRLANALSGYPIDLLLAVFEQPPGTTWVRMPIVDRRIVEWGVLDELAAALDPIDRWVGGMKTELPPIEAEERCRAVLAGFSRPQSAHNEAEPVESETTSSGAKCCGS